MKKKKAIRRILMMAAWFVVISGLATLLIAANRREKGHVCKEILISISGENETIYIQKEDILSNIIQTAKNSLIDQPVTSFNLAKLERSIEKNPWIGKAELYFDSRDCLHAQINERTPVARVFTILGNSFYLDSSGQRMPLLEKMSARVPVITGFTDNHHFNAKDSSILNDIKILAIYIHNNEFWNAQIGQIEITEDSKFQLVPVIGDHIILIGNAEKIDEKLRRLYVFYKQVMSKVGFNKYSALDIEYEGQVVAIKKGQPSAIDSIQLKKNIEELMNKTNLQNANQEMLPADNGNKSDSLKITGAQVALKNSSPAIDQPKVSAETILSQPVKPKGQKQIQRPGKKPKAVMKKMDG
ncbi:MAG TPA: hypothetical protein VGO09_08235, partial [Flavisolibacter sp.]|nr:hypothetical protein [Flavisolibacter sp.]